MSNFQRTRSKVWWGDSPPNIGSPVAQQAWDKNDKPQDDVDWQPQLPHWIANSPNQENHSIDNLAPPNNAQVNWPLRHGSPGSHKSQDSGFSDSDSSPPPSQYYPPSQSDSKITNKSSSSSDSNNNENITVKQVIDFQNTPSKDVVDNATKSDNNNNLGIPTPKPRLRSSSVIQTPYDLQKYYEVHHDEQHMELLKESPEKNIIRAISVQETPVKYTETTGDESISGSSMESSANNKKKNVTKVDVHNPPKQYNDNENREYNNETKDISKSSSIISPSKKYPIKKSFVSSQEIDSTKVSKVAKVKDLETSKTKSEESLEYIKLADNNEIAVNNQPRIRSPISNISYIPTERISTSRPDYRRSMSNEDNLPITTTPKFQRNRLNKSLNFEAQRLDQQILDIQDGCHSLDYIEEDVSPTLEVISDEKIHQPTKAILGKNIMDSLNLKPTKKVGPKAKQRMATKTEKYKDPGYSFKLFANKREKPGVVSTHAGGTMPSNRVPSLGLPRSSDQNQWVVVGYPEEERLIPHYTERLIDGGVPSNADSNEQRTRTPKYRKISPPPQFKDKTRDEGMNKEILNLTHDSKREKLKETEVNFADVQQNFACTSTPKMLAPHEMFNTLTPNATIMNGRRTNLLESFNG